MPASDADQHHSILVTTSASAPEACLHCLRSQNTMADDTVEMFVYTGVGEGAVVPQDVVLVRVDPTVLAIPADAFRYQSKMNEVQLHDGSYGIGKDRHSSLAQH